MMSDSSRVMSTRLRSKIMSADDAAALVLHGANVGMSGFTGSGYPKAVPLALAHRIEKAHARGEPFRIGVWTGASTAPELDGALALKIVTCCHAVRIRAGHDCSDSACGDLT